MKAVIYPGQQLSRTYNVPAKTFSLTAIWHKFIAYASAQENNRLLWSAISIFGHGTIFTIATLAVVILTGNLFFLMAATCLTMTMVLIVNLAALPTKYTIPVLLASVFIDLLIIATAVALA